MTEKRAKGSWQEHDAIDATEELPVSMPIDIALPGGWSGCGERDGRP